MVLLAHQLVMQMQTYSRDGLFLKKAWDMPLQYTNASSKKSMYFVLYLYRNNKVSAMQIN